MWARGGRGWGAANGQRLPTLRTCCVHARPPPAASAHLPFENAVYCTTVVLDRAPTVDPWRPFCGARPITATGWRGRGPAQVGLDVRRLWGTLRVPHAGRTKPTDGRETRFREEMRTPTQGMARCHAERGPLANFRFLDATTACLTLRRMKPDARYVAAARSLTTTARIVRTLYADSVLYIVI